LDVKPIDRRAYRFGIEYADSPQSMRKLLRKPEKRCSGSTSSERGGGPLRV
jgi:hypothetical protein